MFRVYGCMCDFLTGNVNLMPTLYFAARKPCDAGYTDCPQTKVCIRETSICDGNNDCGDHWDETPEICRKSRDNYYHSS